MTTKIGSPTKKINKMQLRKEQMFMKLARTELIVIGCNNAIDGVDIDLFRRLKELKKVGLERKFRSHSILHNHPSNQKFSAMPSLPDIFGLHGDPFVKTSIIAQTDLRTGEVKGYTFLRKKIERRKLTLDEMDKFQEYLYEGKRADNMPNFNHLLQLCGMQYRCVPTEGHQFNRRKCLFEAIQ